MDDSSNTPDPVTAQDAADTSPVASLGGTAHIEELPPREPALCQGS